MIFSEIMGQDIIEEIDILADNDSLEVEEFDLDRPQVITEAAFQIAGSNCRKRKYGGRLPWDEWYALFLEYKAAFCRLPSARTVFRGKELGSWYGRQKLLFKSGKLSPDHASCLFENFAPKEYQLTGEG